MERPQYIRAPRTFDINDNPLQINRRAARITIYEYMKYLSDLRRYEELNKSTESGSWHLSLNHKCIKWLPLEKKKKIKLKGRTNDCRHPELLLLGTGGGDVSLVLPAAQLKWKTNDCHPEGVCAISFSAYRFTCMSCQTDPAVVNLMGKFRASTKATWCMVLSHDGKIIARPVESF